MHVTHWLSLGGVAVLLACGDSTSTSNGNTKTVTIQDFSFSPAAETVKVGAMVRWVNHGPSAHTTVSDAGLWNSGTLNAPSGGGIYGGGTAGGSFQHTFPQAGTFPYHCQLHPPSMYPGFTGTITVTP